MIGRKEREIGKGWERKGREKGEEKRKEKKEEKV